MTISYPNVEAEIPIVANSGTHINFAQYLSQVFAGGGYSTYWAYNDDNFDATRGFWQAGTPQHSFFTLNGVTQPEGFFNVSPAQLSNVEIVVGNEICSRMMVQVKTGTGPGPGEATWTQFWIDVIPAVYTDPTPQVVDGSDVVAAARAFGAHFAGASSPDGCHDIAHAFAAAAGAPLPIDSGSLVPSENQDGGVWTVVHRGDVDPNPHWQSSLQPGDIVRFDYADPNQPQHTFTVFSMSAAGVETLDNWGGALNFHTTNFESFANPATVTVYRITSPLHELDGAASNDFLSGSTLNDKLVGFSGDDVLNGGAGNDLIFGGLGNDIINGDAGVDTAGYVGFSTQYSIGSHGQTVNGPEGSDQLTDIEIIQFADGRMVYDQGDAVAIAYRMYDSAFGRAPDSYGQNGWTTALQKGLSVADMASGFAASPEFVATYGPLNNQQFVEQLYRNVLDREGEATGVAGWTNALNANAMSRGQVLAGFSESNEHIQKLAPEVSAGIFDVNETAASVARLYDAAFNRLPDGNGLLGWKDAVDHGMSLSTVADGFAFSAEFQNTYGNLGNQGFVEQLYHNVLDRAGEAAGVAGWTAALASGQMDRGDVLLGFSESLEHQTNTAGVIDHGIWIV